MDPILQIKDLQTHFFTKAGVLKAVDGVSLEIGAGEIVGLVGARAHCWWPNPVQRTGSGKIITRRNAGLSRQPDCDDFPRSDDDAKSGFAH